MLFHYKWRKSGALLVLWEVTLYWAAHPSLPLFWAQPGWPPWGCSGRRRQLRAEKSCYICRQRCCKKPSLLYPLCCLALHLFQLEWRSLCGWRMIFEVARTNPTDELDTKNETMYWSFILGLLDLVSGKVYLVFSILDLRCIRMWTRRMK